MKLNINAVKLFAVVLSLTGMMAAMPAERGVAAPSAASAVAQDAPLININNANVDEMQLIRGIGPALAERIVQYRDENGAFESAEDLAQVRGIGGSKLQKIKKQIKV